MERKIMTKQNTHTTTYRYNDEYFIDIVMENKPKPQYLGGKVVDYFHFEAWLHHKDFRIKMLMFGMDMLKEKWFLELAQEQAEEYFDEFQKGL